MGGVLTGVSAAAIASARSGTLDARAAAYAEGRRDAMAEIKEKGENPERRKE